MLHVLAQRALLVKSWTLATSITIGTEYLTVLWYCSIMTAEYQYQACVLCECCFTNLTLTCSCWHGTTLSDNN